MMWTRMAKETMTSNHTVAKAMKPIFKSDEVKGLFFLTTLPGTIDNTIDNLSTQNLTSFSAIKLIFQDIAEKHSIEVSIVGVLREQAPPATVVAAPVPDFTAPAFSPFHPIPNRALTMVYSSAYPRH
jgi:hypothetical protein